MNLTMIVSNDDSKSKIVWDILERCDFFDDKLISKPVILGEIFYNTLPILHPNKRYILVSSNLENENQNITIFKDNYQLLKRLEMLTEEFIMVSDKEMYNYFLPYVEKLYLIEFKNVNNKLLFNNINFTEIVVINNDNYKMIEYRKVR